MTRCGHKLQELAEAGGWLGEALWGHSSWRAWAAGHLKERLELEALDTWACGRPSAPGEGGDSGGEEEEGEAGKEFDMSSMSQSLGLSRDVYNRYAGAGGAEERGRWHAQLMWRDGRVAAATLTRRVAY